MEFVSIYLNTHQVMTFFFTSIAFTMFKAAGQRRKNGKKSENVGGKDITDIQT